jgi:hypothetical protein
VGSLSDNGGGWPPDGGTPDDLPDLPPEWGDVVVPDDLSALADEVAAVRAELGSRQGRTRWQRFTARPGVRRIGRLAKAAVRAPVLIVALAVLVTMASLFASTWPGPARPPSGQRTSGTGDDGLDILPALELIGADGQAVALRGQLPAVIMLVDGCDCGRLVADTAAAVPAGTTVLSVLSGATSSAPTMPTTAGPPAASRPVRQLHDPASALRSAFHYGAADGTAAVLLVDRTGFIVRSVARAASVEVFRPDLARL